MAVVLADAGLAEAATFFALLIVGGAVLLAAGLVALSWWKHSFTAVVIACLLIIISGGMLQPWNFVISPPTGDPDDVFWLFWERIVSGIWLLLSLSAIICLGKVIRFRRLKKCTQGSA